MTTKRLLQFSLVWVHLGFRGNVMACRCFLILFVLVLIGAVPCFAQFTPISSPDASYTGSTTLIPITAANGTPMGSLTGGTTTLTFSNNLNAATVPGGGWGSWNSPPNAETATPRVGSISSATTTFTISLSTPQTTFGFEAEPNNLSAFDFTATFMNGASTVGTITRTVIGSSGSLLFAAASETSFTSVVLTMPAGAGGFALAQFRVASTPASIPTLAEWGFATLVLLILASGVFILKRQQVSAHIDAG
jgi:hypothetical protein